MPLPLPIDDHLPAIVDSLARHQCLALQAPTGAGKTARVAPALLQANAFPGQIILIEPRRVAARAAARFMAAEHGSQLGDWIGYQVRFDRKAGSNTRILAVTPGIYLRMLRDDPSMPQVSAVLIDEFHERGLEQDLGLAFTRLVQQTIRPDLRLVAMSATLAASEVAAYFDECPIISCQGRLHPVRISYQEVSASIPIQQSVAATCKQWIERSSGDILVFLPGMSEIRACERELAGLASSLDLDVMPLHGDLPSDAQDVALAGRGRKRIVLSTNVAESSVTVSGITLVIDTGVARQLSFDPSVGLDRLQTVPISQAAADQRAGRAGRTQPGVCVRLWSESAHAYRPAVTEPEIRRVDLAGAVLYAVAMGERDVPGLPWLEPPSGQAITSALALLERLGAIHDGAITELGNVMSRLPVPPRLGKLLVAAHSRGCLDEAASIAAFLTERNPGYARLGDIRDAARLACNEGFQNSRIRAQLVRTCLDALGREPSKSRSDDDLAQALLSAFPDRVARRREIGSQRGLLMGGRGVRIQSPEGSLDGELFLAIDVDDSKGEAIVRHACTIRREWLPGVRRALEGFFDEKEESVKAMRRIWYEDLLLEESPAGVPDAEATTRLLRQAAIAHLDRVLPPFESDAGRLLTRLRCLREWLPELGLPDYSEPVLQEMVEWLCPGRRSFADLRAADWMSAILGKLSQPQRQALEREAPDRLATPQGSRVLLRYKLGRPPILAVRIQELFGLPETPRIARGRVKVLLHLLAPNYRPQQVTDDLASFWKNTYPRVRKDLRGRYPKHAWPEDPCAAG